MSESLDPRLLAVLVCPACHGDLRSDEASLVCTAEGCGLRYPVVDGIPILLVDEAGRD